MPKRLLRHHLENTAKGNRKSNNDESKNDASEGKHMQYLKLNQNNEIERLLLHNSKTLLYHVDHCVFPAFNVGIWPQKANDILTTYPTCGFSTPRPIYIANKQCERVDICYKRPMNENFHKTRIRHTRTSYKTVLKSNKAIRSSVKDGFYHSSVYEMAERFYMQPDPFFHSSYDFYFTGGNLCTLPLHGNIVHAEGEKLHEITVSDFSFGGGNDDNYLHKIISHTTPEDCEIFELQPLLTSLGTSRQNCFIARQRNLISLIYVKDKRQIKTVTQFRTKLTPFISFAQSERNINNFIITTLKQHVRLYDLNNSSPALVELYEISPKMPNISWNTVKPWRENTFLYANENQFFLIDVRTSPKQWMTEVTSATESLNCNNICAVMPSEFNNLFYVATNHNLQCMDIRHLKKFSFSDIGGAICRWTHQLRYAPLMMDTFRLRQTEYIALSSPIAGDLHICQLSRERNKQEISLESSQRVQKHIYSSSCLPYQPPTFFEAYKNARLSGKCLMPESNLEARLKCCTTGMKFIKSSVNNAETAIGLLLTSNSNGDVFAQSLSKRETEDNEIRSNRQSDEIMQKFESMCKNHQQPLYYSDIQNMKGVPSPTKHF